MKKNITLTHGLFLLPLIISSGLMSMNELENEGGEQYLMESTIMTYKPSERGLGFVRSTLDFLWDEEENLFDDLVTKKYNPNNSSYPRKLDKTVEIYVSKANSDRITEIFSICRMNYPKLIKINDSQALMAHEFLVKENKNKQFQLKNAIEIKDQEFIKEQNILLDALQKSVTQDIKKIDNLFNKHLQERDSLVTEAGDEIRKLKTGLVNLHHLNKTFILPEDGYCSDEERNENNLKNSYNDVYLLRKIDVAYTMQATKDKIKRLLEQLFALNKMLQDIEPIRY